MYIVAVNFIGGGNRRTQRKPPTCCKSLKKISTVEFELTTLVVIDTDCTGSWIYNNLHMITTTTAPIDI
jgi:hypothetical protein